MIEESTLKGLDRNIAYFVWFMEEFMKPILEPELSCDGHYKQAAYIIVQPIVERLFNQFRKAVTRIDGVYLDTVMIGKSRKWKLTLSYSNNQELFYKQQRIMRIGEKLCH